jgi:hypothetical protein
MTKGVLKMSEKKRDFKHYWNEIIKALIATK